MAETSYLWDNPGTGDSPAGGYGNALLCRAVFRMLLGSDGDRGVLHGWLDDLEVTDGGGLDAAVGAGAALCYGAWHESDEAETVALPDNSTVHVVVRADWAAQTARLAQVAALTQNPGVTYDVPLAEVTTAGGAIALITDERDYCEYPTVLEASAVTADNIQTGAATVAKMIDQARHLSRGAGEFVADATNPATWGGGTTRGTIWLLADAATNAAWCTFRVPADISSAAIDFNVWFAGAALDNGDVLWSYSLWQAAAGGVLANTAGTMTTTFTASDPTQHEAVCELLASVAAAAGDLVHLRVERLGADGADTWTHSVILWGISIDYTADS